MVPFARAGLAEAQNRIDRLVVKLLLVIDSLGSGGAQNQFVNIVNGLSEWHDVTVFLYNPGSEFYRADLLPDIHVHHVERPEGKKGFRLNVLWKLIRFARASDVVISFLPTANTYCAIAVAFCPKTKQISCEMSVTNETESRLRRSMANFANKSSDHVICNSFTQAEHIANLPGMEGKVSTVWNGCSELACTERDLSERQKYGFLIVARVAYPKNGVRLLQALELFNRRNGYVPQVSWAGRDDLDARAKQMKADMVAFLDSHPKVKERFTWLGEVADVQSLYAQSDALMSVSTYEGVPVVICEAMLSGCPVVASAISDNAIILGEGARGFLCDPHSSEDICQAMERRLQATVDDLRSMTGWARAYAEEKFSIEQMLEGYHQVIIGLAGRR